MTKITKLNYHNLIFENYNIKLYFTGRKKSLAIRVNRQNEIEILAPKNINEKFIINFLANKKPWLDKKLSISNKSKVKKNHAYIFGKETAIIAKKSDKNYFSFEDEKLILYYAENLAEKKILFLFNEFIKNSARKFLHDRFINLSKNTNLIAKELILKNNISKWGSCSNKKIINLSFNLICTKKSVIDYVIIHELCHLIEMNHSKNFWQLVENYCPNYKAENKWLKEHNFLINQADHLELSTLLH